MAVTCLVLAVVGCSNTNDVVNTGPEGISAERLAPVMQRLRGVPLARAAAGAVQRVWSQAIDCPPTFDLGDAAGSCIRNEGTGDYYGTVYDFLYMNLTSHVSVAEGGPALDVAFDVRVEPVDGGTYLVEVFSGSAGISEGSGDWNLRGYVDLGGRFDATLRTSRGAWTLRDGRLEFTDVRVPYIAVRVSLDSGVGEIQFGGSPFASVAVVGGCVTVDFVDPAREDEQTCQW